MKNKPLIFLLVICAAVLCWKAAGQPTPQSNVNTEVWSSTMPTDPPVTGKPVTPKLDPATAASVSREWIAVVGIWALFISHAYQVLSAAGGCRTIWKNICGPKTQTNNNQAAPAAPTKETTT